MGVIVQDGLRDVSVLDHVGIIEKRQKELGISGIWTILEVSVNESDIKKVVGLLEKHHSGPHPGESSRMGGQATQIDSRQWHGNRIQVDRRQVG